MRHRWLHHKVALVILALIMSGCAFDGSEEPDQIAPAPEPTQVEAPVVVIATLADMLPKQDWQVVFQITDEGKAPVTVQEDLLREPEQLVVTQDGIPYVNWLIREDGLWRQDPRGGGALLRYLPPDLSTEEAWLQTSGGADIWFRLTPGNPLCTNLTASQRQIAAQDCWTVTVLNRGEQFTVVFAPGLGPVFAESKDWNQPAESFVKQMQRDRLGALSAEHRTDALSRVRPVTSEPARVVPVSLEAFNQAVRAAGQ